MNANASAIGTPSGERYRTALSNFARGDASCFARNPLRFAGEMRKIFAGMSVCRLLHNVCYWCRKRAAIAAASFSLNGTPPAFETKATPTRSRG